MRAPVKPSVRSVPKWEWYQWVPGGSAKNLIKMSRNEQNIPKKGQIEIRGSAKNLNKMSRNEQNIPKKKRININCVHDKKIS